VGLGFTAAKSLTGHRRAALRHSLDECRGRAIDVCDPIQLQFDAHTRGRERRPARMLEASEVGRGQPAGDVHVQAIAFTGDSDSCHDAGNGAIRWPYAIAFDSASSAAAQAGRL
jgi:hypothetical protein